MVSRDLNFKTVEEARAYINKSKMVVNPPVVKNQVVRDTTYISEQKELSNWLRSQTQQVRDDFGW